MVLPSEREIAIGERLKPQPGTRTIHTSSLPGIPARVNVAVVGAGVIGLSIAWRLASRGMSVAVFDRGEAGTGASLAATGMLAAAAEHEPGGEDLLSLAVESQSLWPQFSQFVEAESEIAIDYRDHGTLVVALSREEVDRLRFRHEHQKRSGLQTQWLNGMDTRALEPGLRSSVAAGIFCEQDHQVDPRRLIPALTRAFRSHGGQLLEHCPVTSLEMSGGRLAGLQTPSGPCRAETVIVANGVASVDGLLPAGIDLPVRPLKGQALALRTNRQTGTLSHVVWTEQIHLAPKGDGRLIVGATMEDAGFDAAVTAGGALALLDGVHRALPSSEDMQLEAIWSGFRPTSDDDAPIIGLTGLDGLLIATGHHRNGILLAPITAKAIEELVTTGEISGAAARFGLERFQSPAAQVQAAGAHR